MKEILKRFAPILTTLLLALTFFLLGSWFSFAQAQVELTPEQHETCSRFSNITAAIQQWRRDNPEENTLNKFLATETEATKVEQLLAVKVFEAPVQVPPVMVGTDFNMHCIMYYTNQNANKVES